MPTENTAPAPPDQLPTNGAATTTPPRRKLKRSTRISLVIILIMAVIAAAGYGVSKSAPMINARTCSRRIIRSPLFRAR